MGRPRTYSPCTGQDDPGRMRALPRCPRLPGPGRWAPWASWSFSWLVVMMLLIARAEYREGLVIRVDERNASAVVWWRARIARRLQRGSHHCCSHAEHLPAVGDQDANLLIRSQIPRQDELRAGLREVGKLRCSPGNPRFDAGVGPKPACPLLVLVFRREGVPRCLRGCVEFRLLPPRDELGHSHGHRTLHGFAVAIRSDRDRFGSGRSASPRAAWQAGHAGSPRGWDDAA